MLLGKSRAVELCHSQTDCRQIGFILMVEFSLRHRWSFKKALIGAPDKLHRLHI